MKNYFYTIVLLTILSSSVAFSASLLKNDFEIINDTRYNLSFSFDHLCSPEMFIPRFTHRTFSKDLIKTACHKPSNCSMEVYTSFDKCTGNSIATFAYDLSGWGVINIVPHSKKFQFGANAYNLFFNER